MEWSWEVEMVGSMNVRKAVGLLAEAAMAALGGSFTGQIVIRLNAHNGTVGKVTVQTEEVIAPA